LDGRWACIDDAGAKTVRSYVESDGALLGRDTLNRDSENGETFVLERFTRDGENVQATTREGQSIGTLGGRTLTLHGTRATDGAPFALTYAVESNGFVRTLTVRGTRTSERCGAVRHILDAEGCLTQDWPARVLVVQPPQRPDGTAQLNGDVVVAVTLDADSEVVGAQIASSPSPALDDAALTSAVESRYQGAITQCVSLPATYLFTVSFTP
jgi:hypothetical protein